MNTAKTIEVSFDMNFGDLYKGTLAASIYVLRYLIRAVLVVGALYVFCFAAGSIRNPWRCNADAVAGWLLPYLIGIVPTTLILVPLIPFVRLRRMVRTPGMEGKRIYIFSDDGIRFESELGTTTVKWEAYGQVRETRNYFLLFATPGFANILPKRYFSNKDQINDFRSLVRDHLRKFKLRRD
jgi:hypothetical protein